MLPIVGVTLVTFCLLFAGRPPTDTDAPAVAPHLSTEPHSPPPPLANKTQLCRQYLWCGIDDMQRAYEGHLTATRLCLTELGKSESDLPERITYTSNDVTFFHALYHAYHKLEVTLLECSAEVPIHKLDAVYHTVRYPAPLMKVPSHMGVYEQYKSGPNTSVPGKANRYVHATWKTVCVSPWHNHLPNYGKIDKDQQIVWWTDSSIKLFIETVYKNTKFHVVFRRLELLKQRDKGLGGVMASDLFRALLMLSFGGVYADMDIETTKPWHKVFEKYDVVGTFEPMTQNSGQWRTENWRPGMRSILGGSFVHFASKPNLPFWQHHVNKAIDFLNEKGNGGIKGCHPVPCSGPAKTAGLFYEYYDTHPPSETDRVKFVPDTEFFEMTGMRHHGHCSWCGHKEQRVESYFDIRAAIPPPGLLFPPGTQEGECTYSEGLVALFDPSASRGSKPNMSHNEDLKKQTIQHPQLQNGVTHTEVVLQFSKVDEPLVMPDTSHLCRMEGACGMAEMQQAYEGHVMATQRCYSYQSKPFTSLPAHLDYVGFDEREFPRLLAAYNEWEGHLWQCLQSSDDDKIGRIHYFIRDPAPVKTMTSLPQHGDEATQ